MKLKTVLLIASLMVSLPAFAAKEIKVNVLGMVCAFCGQGITKNFKARPEVKDIKVSLNDKTVLLTLKDGKDISDKDISTIIEESGVKVEKIERSGK